MKNRILLGILLVALIVRVGLLLLYNGTGVAEQQDAKDYAAIAANLLNGTGFRNLTGEFISSRGPGYPVFLAGIYAVFGYSDFWVKLLQCVIDTASVLLIFFVALKMLGRPAALCAAAIAALYPPMILYSNLRLSETIFTFFVVSEVFLWMRVIEDRSTRHSVLAGAVHGIATLCRSALMFFPLFMLPVVLLLMKSRKGLLRCFLIYLLMGSGVISVWTVRNYVTFSQLIAVTTGSGHLMWFAIQPDAWDGDRLIELSPEREYADLSGVPRHKWDRIIVPRVARYARENPLSYAKVVLKNEIRLWYLPVGKVILSGKSQLLAALYQYAHLFFLGGAMAGLLLLNRPAITAGAPLLALLVYVAVMHSIVLAVPRYRLPFDFILIILFAGAALGLCRRVFPGKVL